MTKRAYMTYFDQRYASRGVVMIRSLLANNGDGTVFVLCLDDVTREILDALGDARIRTVQLSQVHEYEPGLLAMKGRDSWPFYATHKPVFPLYIFRVAPEMESVTHVDADCRVYRSFDPMFARLEGASVGISPHDFSSIVRPDLARYGAFNAGFIHWRNDDEAKMCLAVYREQCFDWCAPEPLPDGRFMNQGYLDAWPDEFEGVRLIDDPAINVGYWNAAHRAFSKQGDKVFVNRSPLTMFHFAGATRDEAGEWDAYHPGYADKWEFIWDNLISPYIAEVDAEQARIDLRWPGLKKAGVKKGRF